MFSLLLSSARDFPNNHGGDFSNTLNKPLELIEPHTVSLSAISYLPHSWYNVREGYNTLEIEMQGFHVDRSKFILVYGYELAETDDGVNKFHRQQGDQDYEIAWVGSYDTTRVVVDLENITTHGGANLETWVKNDANRYCICIKNYPSTCLYGQDWLTKPFSLYHAEFEELVDGQIRVTYHTPETRTCTVERTYSDLFCHMYKITSAMSNDQIELMRTEPQHDARNENEILCYFDYRPVIHHENVSIPARQYSSAQDLLDTISHTVTTRVMSTLRHEDATSQVLTSVSQTTMCVMNHAAESVNFSISAQAISQLELRIRLNQTLQFQLGFIDYASDDIGWMSKSGFSKHAPDLSRNAVKSLWIFCDFIHPNMVGSAVLPLLRFMPVDSSTQQVSYETFSALIPRLINKARIDNIRIWFSEYSTGEPALYLKAGTFVRLQIEPC